VNRSSEKQDRAFALRVAIKKIDAFRDVQARERDDRQGGEPWVERLNAPSLCTDPCASHPEGRTHECLATEMRCAYCGVRLAPYPCNGCGKFLNAKHMHEASGGEPWRCEECRGF
jgi:DNA-directed RNA polymerase subunit RPC12/RpoP